jgi:hypothetical protein
VGWFSICMVKFEDHLTHSLGNIGLDLVSFLGSLRCHSAILSTQSIQVQDIKCSILLYFSARFTCESNICARTLNSRLISTDILPPILSPILFSIVQGFEYHRLGPESHSYNHWSCPQWCWIRHFSHKTRSLSMGPGSRLGVDDLGKWLTNSSGCRHSFVSLDPPSSFWLRSATDLP